MGLGTRALGALLGIVTGCGGGAGGGVDAGVDGGVAEIAAPAPPLPPVLTPCAPGWREVDDGDGVTICDPWPATGMATCADDEAHFPGEPGCTRIGSACPAGEWAEGLPAGPTVRYVRAGGAPGGNGSTATPFGTIAEATAAATPGTIIALGKGAYDEVVHVGASVTVWGACVAETTVAVTGYDANTGAFVASGAGGVVKNLRIGGDRMGVYLPGAGGTLHLADVVVAAATESGVLVSSGGALSAHTLVVRDMTPRPMDMRFGRGLEVNSGGQLDLARVVLLGNHDVGLYVGSSATATVDDIAILDMLPSQATAGSGAGVVTRLGGTLELSRAVIARSRAQAVLVFDPGTVLRLTDVVLRDTLGNSGLAGQGLWVYRGGTAEVVRALVERQRSAAVLVQQPDSALTLTDVVVRDTAAEAASGYFGRALESQEAAIEVTRALFLRSTSGGIIVSDGGTVALTDLVVRDVAAEVAAGERGNGVVVQYGPNIVITRAVIERTRAVGVQVTARSLAGDTRPTSVVATDLVVRDTGSQASDGRYGRALNVQNGATLDVTRALLERNRDLGIYASGVAASAHLADVVITDTSPQECAASDSCAWDITASAGAYGGATIDARRFRFTRSGFLGLQLASGGTADLHEGEISFSAIGANVQTEGFDVARLSDRVVFVDNDINLASELLETPEAAGP